MRIRKKIILVDDDITNLTVGKSVLGDLYDTLTLPSGERLLEVIDTVKPDLILLDINMPNMSGFEVISRLKSNPKYVDIPVIFLSARNDTESELRGLNLGAIDYISKPFSAPLLRRRIETHILVIEQKQELMRYNTNLVDIIKEKTRTVYNLQNAVLNTVAELVECRDDVTGGHIIRTQHYVRLLLGGMARKGVYKEEVSRWDTDFILPSCQLHDVGKIMIPDHILKKTDNLTHEEFELVKKHPEQGALIIETIAQNTEEKSFLHHARVFALSHHEKWDGSGYPFGLSGASIPLQGRIMAIADVYDALVSERPYKPPLSHEEARKIIEVGSGTHFDPILIDIFLSVENCFKRISRYKTDVEMQTVQHEL